MSSRPPRPARNTASVGKEQVVAGIRISNPDRLIYPDPRTSKLGVARYYAAIGEWIVPHVAGRPLTLVRCPEGIGGPCVFMKHSKVWGPSPLRRVRIQERTKVGEYLIADDLAGVVALVQIGVLEIHTWNSSFDHDVDRPNRIVIDLDPGENVPWPKVVEGARLVRRALTSLDLDSYAKTTGGRGLHVVVPLVPKAGWSDCLLFSRRLCEAVERADPDAYTTRYAKRGRENKILLDYLRNNRTNTSIAAYSTRARDGGPVSLPISWEALRPGLDPRRFTIATVPALLGRRSVGDDRKKPPRGRNDPWRGYWTCRQSLTRERIRAVDATR